MPSLEKAPIQSKRLYIQPVFLYLFFLLPEREDDIGK
jgi:hypothetical protein